MPKHSKRHKKVRSHLLYLLSIKTVLKHRTEENLELQKNNNTAGVIVNSSNIPNCRLGWGLNEKKKPFAPSCGEADTYDNFSCALFIWPKTKGVSVIAGVCFS